MPNLLTNPAERSALMALIRSTNTKPELIVFAELRLRRISFQPHYERVAGRPDVARPRRKLAVFIDGDFWHGRELDRVVRQRGDDSPWAAKLRRNMARDIEQVETLEQSGWRVLRVWESDITRIRTRAQTMDQIVSFLRSRDEGSK